MAVTINFDVGQPCSGGNHIDIIATLNFNGAIRERSYPTTRLEMTTNPTDEELEATVRVLLRLMVRQAPQGATANQIKNAIEAKTIDLTVT